MANEHGMDGRIMRAVASDIDEIERLYDALIDHLVRGTNHPHWRKGIYPVRQTAEDALADGHLFVMKIGEEIAGTTVLSHRPEEAYAQLQWGIEADYADVIVIHTLAVHPHWMKRGIARELMIYAEQHARAGGMKAIRLDVVGDNAPAIALYEGCGYTFRGLFDLGIPGLPLFRGYDLIL